MSDISPISSGLSSSQLLGRLTSSTLALKNSVKSEQAIAQIIEKASKAASQTGGIDVYA